MENFQWSNYTQIPSKSFSCGYCGHSLASALGYQESNGRAFVYICHFCTRPTFISVDGEQSPGAKFGTEIEEISDVSVLDLYNEARNCISVSSYTAAVLCCRKLLMNIAVHKGAKEGLKFYQYVEFLSDNHYVPPDAKEWVDHIRKKGNEATHEITIMGRDEAEEIISFVEMILRLVYEFPARIKKKTSPTPVK